MTQVCNSASPAVNRPSGRFHGVQRNAQSTLVRNALSYGRAKSEGNAGRAAQWVSEDFELSMPVLGTTAVGPAGMVEAMRRLYVSFPDYRFVVESVVGDERSVVLSGRMVATFSSLAEAPGTAGLGLLSALGLVRRRSVDLPAIAMFLGRDGVLTHETFVVDGVALASAMGLPIWLVARVRRASIAAGVIR